MGGPGPWCWMSPPAGWTLLLAGLWDVLLQDRADTGHTIIFMTRHLEEAEAPSDRMAILQQGQLRSCGPHLADPGPQPDLHQTAFCLEVDGLKDTVHITVLIQTHVPSAILRDSSGRQLLYAISKDTDPTCFTGLFQDPEQDQQHLHVAGLRLADTTFRSYL
ncbi:ATP-binding cassette sub-family A member 13-like [Molossus nigricans]